MSDVATRLREVRASIDAAARRAGRDPAAVHLVAVSKFQPLAAMREAFAAGQRLFGENYAQELREKAKALEDCEGLELHFIGTLQKNKAKYVAPLAAMFHALDTLELAKELDKRAAAAGRVLPVLLEVNLGEAQKGGVAPEAVEPLADAVRGLAALELRGLMCMPPPADDAEASRPHFRTVAALGSRLGLQVLSMGMSADYEVAIEEGATHVRVGTAIFGARPAPGAR
ncbi:MAG: YggS family pyridoxal phosphate-dependent enzyme [Myxococcales bacterium]